MKKVAVVLSGCGFKDGTEINEAICTFIALGQNGCRYECFAPDFTVGVINHLTGQEEAGDQRHILSESARLSRGEIHSLSVLKAQNFDAVIFPGGFGAALHLCSWAHKGAACEVLSDVKRIILDFHSQSKPIGAICIAPVLLAKTLGEKKISITIGNDPETIAEIKKTGALHIECPVDDFITDRDHKLITTPAYMYVTQPHEVFKGISRLVQELAEMA